MLTTFFVVLPIFALIFLGFFCRRANVLGPHATTELNRFVVYLALPALLFDIMAHSRWATLDQPAFAAVFTLSTFIVFALTILLRLRGARGAAPRHLADVSIDGLNAGYGNTGFIGFPLSLIVFGRGMLGLTTVAAIITVCLLFAVAIVLIEIGLQTEARPTHLLLKVGRSLIRNPLLVAPVLGAPAGPRPAFPSRPAPRPSSGCSATRPRPAPWWRSGSSWASAAPPRHPSAASREACCWSA